MKGVKTTIWESEKTLNADPLSDYKKLSGKRRTRVYYHIEEQGNQLFEQLKEDYHAINAGVEKILSGGAPAAKAGARTRKKKEEK